MEEYFRQRRALQRGLMVGILLICSKNRKMAGIVIDVDDEKRIKRKLESRRQLL